jgi:hypothetical protein
VMTQVNLGLTNVTRFDSADSVISVNNANKKHGASQRAAATRKYWVAAAARRYWVATRRAAAPRDWLARGSTRRS